MLGGRKVDTRLSAGDNIRHSRPDPHPPSLYPPLGTDIFDSGPNPAQNRPKPTHNRPKTSPNLSKTGQKTQYSILGGYIRHRDGYTPVPGAGKGGAYTSGSTGPKLDEKGLKISRIQAGREAPNLHVTYSPIYASYDPN